MEHCPEKVSKISLECIYETHRNVKGVIENAGASTVECLKDIVMTCKARPGGLDVQIEHCVITFMYKCTYVTNKRSYYMYYYTYIHVYLYMHA